MAERRDAKPEAVRLQWGVKIPLRDGTRLSATLYRAMNQVSAAPALFSLTPYTVDPNHPRACYFAGRGYPFLIVDARGRGNSEGTFRPYIQEPRDAADVVEWIAGQPFCDGRVGMFSGSYEGYNQWCAAKERPAALKTITPAMSPALGIDFPMRNNIPYPYAMRWITGTSGRASQPSIVNDQKFWRNQFRAWYESGRPFSELDEILGNPSSVFQEWVSHPVLDEYWDAYMPRAEDYADIDLPILTLTGSYDSGQIGALYLYREHMRRASQDARSKHYLVIGPWDHTGTLLPKPEFGGIKFGPAAMVDVLALHAEWYDWVLRGGPRPSFLKKNVAYYVMGAEKWRYSDSLEAVTERSQPFYLDSPGSASHLHRSGTLNEQVGNGPPDTYVYDPRDTSIAAVETDLEFPPQLTLLRPIFPADSLVDQSLVQAHEGRSLIYHSAPFSHAVQISGFFRLSAWIAIDQPDTDFGVTVYEIQPDGRSILLTSDLMRARHRESLRGEILVRTHEPLRYDFERFTFVSREMQRGSRLRLVIGPVNSMHYQKNYNSGKAVATESMADARPVTVKLHHDEGHPSALYVPFGSSED
jgi:uncharacterized protein